MKIKSLRNAVIQILLERQKGVCWACDEGLSKGVFAVQFAKDLKSEGGKEEIENMELVHRSCLNRGKRHRGTMMAQYLRKQGKTPQEIADQMHRSLRMVYLYLKKEPVPEPPKPIDNDRW